MIELIYILQSDMSGQNSVLGTDMIGQIDKIKLIAISGQVDTIEQIYI